MDLLNNEYVLFFSCAQKNKLRYLLIGGYAVNYYGYNRNTHDLDIWIATTNENKQAFINTLLCMQYSENEVAPLLKEDFTQPYVATIGGGDSTIDFLTVVHHAIIFDEAENKKETFELSPGIFVQCISYDFLINMKLKSRRDKDLFDIARLDEIKNKI